MKRGRAIQSAKAFLKNHKDIESVIRFCDLRPLNKGWLKWGDNLGNFIRICSNKRIDSFENKSYKKVVTDLYYKAKPKDIANISCRVFVTGDEDLCFVWFFGHDSRLRFIAFDGDDWINAPVLSSGISAILSVIEMIKSKKQGATDILDQHKPVSNNPAWVFDWPLSEAAKKQIKHIEIIKLC